MEVVAEVTLGETRRSRVEANGADAALLGVIRHVLDMPVERDSILELDADLAQMFKNAAFDDATGTIQRPDHRFPD
jgi:hypothetical protein